MVSLKHPRQPDVSQIVESPTSTILPDESEITSTLTAEFKAQAVELISTGKPVSKIAEEFRNRGEPWARMTLFAPLWW